MSELRRPGPLAGRPAPGSSSPTCTPQPRFAELWDSGAVGRHEATERKTIDHPQAGTLTLDCDVLTVRGSDLRIMIYTAEPGTEDAKRLALLTVLGTKALVG